METPLQLELQGVPATDHVRTLIERNLSKIEKRFGRATACRIVVRAPGHHHKNGEPYAVGVRIALPAGREVNVGHAPTRDDRLADLDYALNDAFKRALRQLSDDARILQERGRRIANKALPAE
ncbi:MAG: HPF/RaiA family ribosome-associated protein [Alphaproteobacteria bacterium]|nr:HPF/RaiA family ribosome-associated protein [Alphaproteobacteria bacterium]MBV9695228.1 HPF/RaiA family ribosome-associated protein [Alphaproteobacteria bacterium]